MPISYNHFNPILRVNIYVKLIVLFNILKQLQVLLTYNNTRFSFIALCTYRIPDTVNTKAIVFTNVLNFL